MPPPHAADAADATLRRHYAIADAVTCCHYCFDYCRLMMLMRFYTCRALLFVATCVRRRTRFAALLMTRTQAPLQRLRVSGASFSMRAFMSRYAYDACSRAYYVHMIKMSMI